VTIVDIHPHIVSKDVARYPISPLGGKRSDWSESRSIDADNYIASMREAGVDKAAVVHSSTTYGFDCSYLADIVEQHPGVLTGVFSVNVLEPDALAQMQKWIGRGCIGMRIFSRGSTLTAWLSLDDPRIFPCYEYAGEQNVSVASTVTVETFPQLENLLRQFPKTKFIMDHLGRTDFTDGEPFELGRPLWDLARYPNLYLKVATRNMAGSNAGKSTPETLFRKLVAEFGANRLAWGSNYPASEGSLAEMLQLARERVSSLPSSDQDWILGKTALSLYPALGND